MLFLDRPCPRGRVWCSRRRHLDRIAAIGIVFVVAMQAPAQEWDAAGEFSHTTNPNGAWSYGFTTSLGSPLVHYDNPVELASGLQARWSTAIGNAPPEVLYNPTPNPITDASHDITWLPGQMAFHPGPSNQHSVVRWTSPVQALVDVSAEFGLIDLQAETVRVHVLHNSVSIFDATLSGYGDVASALASVAVVPGDTVDFVVGFGSRYDHDNTSIAASVAIPNRPPVISCHSPVILWSPNHELVDASSAFSVDDPDGDPVQVSLRVFSDETEIPDTGDGTGRHAPDFKTQLDSGAAGLFLRSERRGAEDGRFYLGLITGDDGMGGVTEQVCVLAVCPHDQFNPASLDHILSQAAAAAGALDFPAGLKEHGLSAPLGPHQ